MDAISSAIFKGVCYRCVANFVNNSNYAPIFAMELEKLLVNGKITAFWRTDMSPEREIKCYKQQK